MGEVFTQTVPPFPPVINPGDLQSTANAMLLQAEQYLQRLGNIYLTPPTINPHFPVVTQPPTITQLPEPTYLPLIWTPPSIPNPFDGSLNTDGLMPAPFNVTPPVLDFGVAPAPFTGVEPTAPAIDLNFTWPELAVTLPTAPDLMSLRTVTFDGVVIPDIDPTIPVLTAVAPNVVGYGPEQLYSSAELTFYQGTLKDRIQNGGTGLPARIEEAIWNRGRDREYRQMADGLADLERMESLGFAFPPGVYLDARIKMQTEMQYTSATISREIMVKQAELELDNILKSLEQMNSIEGKLIDFTNNMNQRTFEASKYLTEAGIAIYNAQVQAYAARLDAYKARAQIYEAQIHAALAKVDVYKAEIEAEQVKSEINKTLVDEYKVKTEVSMMSVDIFKALLGANQTRAEIERTKVEVYGEEIKAFVGLINATTANVEAYKARVQAEVAREDAFKSQVEAYSAVVGAAAKEIDAKIEEFKARISGKEIEYEGYKATLGALVSKAQAEAGYNQVKAEVYKSEVQALATYNEAIIKEWQAVLDTNMRIAEIAVQTQQANVQAYIQTASIAADAAKVGAQVSAQLGAAALNAIHYSQSASWSGSLSESKSNSSTSSDSIIHSLSV